jgi:cysteine-rich repeat protein
VEPSNFQIVGLDAPFVNVSVDGDFSGSAVACFPYVDANDDGTVDGTSVAATSLKLFHLEGDAWVNVTTNVDTVAHQVCGVVYDFSPFALGTLCGDGDLAGNEDCDDGNNLDDDGCSSSCRFELCRPYPQGNCRTPAPGKGLLKIKVNADPAKSALQWKWSKGAATDKDSFGNPLSQESYRWCIYSGGVFVSTTTLEAGGMCVGKPCWKELAKGYKFNDKEATPDGATQLVLKAGTEGKALIKLKGKGANLDIPSLTALTNPVVIELRKASDDVCWSTTFSTPFRSQSASVFVDTSD